MRADIKIYSRFNPFHIAPILDRITLIKNLRQNDHNMATPDWHLQHRTISNFHGASCQSTSNSFVWENNSNKKPMQKLQTQKKEKKKRKRIQDSYG